MSVTPSVRRLKRGETFTIRFGKLWIMQTIELTIDETLLAQIDRVTSELSLTRAAFIRQALEEALRHKAIFAKERQHALGYEHAPVEPGEFDEWEDEQVWEQS